MAVKKTPKCPKLSIIIRAGHKTQEQTKNALKRLVHRNRKEKDSYVPLELLSFRNGFITVVERVICVYDSQVDFCIEFLKDYDLRGFKVVGRPDGKTFGEDFEFMEHNLIKNPGYILISDLDLLHAVPTERAPGEEKLSPRNFEAKVAQGLCGAKYHGIKLWSVQHQRNYGANYTGQGMKQGDRKLLYHEPGTKKYPRNFFMIAKDACGHWRPVNHLEELGRTLSEGYNVSIFRACVIRYGPADSKVRDRYYRDPEWRKERNILLKLYPNAQLPNEQHSPKFYGKNKILPNRRSA